MNNYHIYEEIAKGKHSTIYKARKKKTIDYYAVKSLEKCRRNKLMNEVKIFHSLDHVNILKFYNWYETKNHLWAIFEYSSGGNLLSLIEQDKKLTELQIKTFTKDLIQGLQHLHSKGVIYCDLKPSNILLNEYGTLKFCDFGLSRRIVDLIQTDEEVKEGSKKGTPSYMAPELFQDDGVYSIQSDLWSLGCVIYEMAVGKPPFLSKSFQDLVWQILNKEVEKVSGFSNEFHEFTIGLLQKNPQKRIGWNELISHPFLNWNSIQLKNLKKIEIPPQPHFERWSNNKYGIQTIFQKNGSSNLASHLKGQNIITQGTGMNGAATPPPFEGVNVLRLSLNVQKNMKRELQEDTYQNNGSSQQASHLNGTSPLNNTNKNSNYILPGTSDNLLNYTAQNKQFNKELNEDKKNDADFFLLNRDQMIDIGYGDRDEEGINEDDFITTPTGLIPQTIDQHNIIQPYQENEDQENYNNFNNTQSKKQTEFESTFKNVYSNNINNNLLVINSNNNNYSGINSDNNNSNNNISNLTKNTNNNYSNNLAINQAYQTGNPIQQFQPLSNGKLGNQNPALFQQPSSKLLSISNRSRFNQQEISTGRQGGQTPTSPNLIQKTPSSKNQTARNNSNGGSSSSSSNHYLQNLNTIGKQNLMKTPSTPHNHSTGSTSNTHAKSVSPYQNNSIYQNSKNNNNTSILSNTNNTSLLNTPTTPLGTTNGFSGVLKNAINIYNIPISNTSSAYSSVVPNSNNSSNNSSIYQNNHYQHQHQHSGSSISNTSHPAISPNRKNSTQNNSSACSSYTDNKILEPTSMTLSKKPSFILESLDKLFIHQTDTQVKPIIGHKDIEKYVQECVFKKETLPFQCYTAVEVENGVERPEIDKLFEQIFSCLHQPNSDKYNILCYFETIVMNSNVSNRLINSAFVNLLLDLLSNVKVPMIRLRVASSIGFLLRYATVIENELSKLNIPTIIIEVLSTEKESKVRRKLMATMGEYLFYAATQVDDDPNNSIWKIQPQILQFLVKTIKNYEEDELVRFYSCKTVENITSQSITVGQFFCNQESILSLISLYFFTRNDDLKASAMVSLTQIARLNNSLGEFVINSLGGMPKLKEILKGDNAPARIQQAVLTLINIQIQVFPQSEMTQIYMIRDPNFIESIVFLLESSHTIIRGKGILTIYLCIKYNPKCLVDLCSTKFFTHFEKLSRDNFKYVQQCYHHLKILNENSIPIMIHAIKDDINRISKGEISSIPLLNQPYYYMQNNNHYGSVMPTLQGNLQYLHVFLQFVKHQQLKSIIFEQNYLEEFFELFDMVHQPHHPSLQEAKSVLINLYEVILGNTSLILDKRQFFMDILLPKLMDQLYINLLHFSANINGSGTSKDSSPLINNSNSSSSCDSADWKFNYIKLIHDIVCIFMTEWQKWSQNSQQRTNELFINKFVGSILNGLVGPALSEDQVSLMTFKVLQILVENQPSLYISALKQKNLLNILLSQFNFNASRSTLKLVAKIVQVSTLQEIQSYGITQKAVGLFQHFISKEQDQCYEDMIDIFLNITTKMISLKPITNIDKPSSFDSFVDPKYDILLDAYSLSYSLLRSLDFALSDKVGMFIIQMIYIYCKQSRSNSGTNLLKNEHILTLVNFITQYQMIVPVMKRNTRILNWIVQLLPISIDMKENIFVNVDKILQNSKDLKINQTLREIHFFLKNPLV